MTASDSVAEQHLARKRFLVYQLPYVVLYVVAIGLVAMTSHDAAGTSVYWQSFIPVVALVSILGGWRHAGAGGQPKWHYLLRQVFHWSALVLAIQLLYAHDVQDFLNNEQDGFVTMYLLGLTAVLSGIYLDWKMALFGLFLLLSGVLMAQLEDNAMLLTVLALVGLAGVAVSLLVRSRVKHHGAEPASAS